MNMNNFVGVAVFALLLWLLYVSIEMAKHVGAWPFS